MEQLGVTVDVSDLRDGRVRLAVDGAAADVAAGRSVDLRGWRLTAETATVDDAKIRVVRAAGG